MFSQKQEGRLREANQTHKFEFSSLVCLESALDIQDQEVIVSGGAHLEQRERPRIHGSRQGAYSISY